MSRISAIVPTFNRADLLRACLDSLLGQTRPLDEILVIDDGSNDDTAQVVAAYGARLRYCRQDNAGKSVALNRALDLISGDLVWICDDDDLALPEAAARLEAALAADPAAGLAYGRYLVFDHAAGPAAARPPDYWPEAHEGDELRALLEDCFLFQFATLVRRDGYRRVGPFRTDLVRSQDYEMGLRLLRHFPARFVDAPLFLQRAHGGLRGTRAEQIRAGQMMARWAEYDRAIFRDLRREMAVADFLPRALAGLSGPGRERAARLERGCVFARRQMWDEAVEDLAVAVRLGDGAAPLPAELAIARRCLLGKHGCADLPGRADVIAAVADLARANAFGAAMVAALAQPLVWRGREALAAGRPGLAAGFVRVLWRWRGPSGAAAALGASLRGKLAAGLTGEEARR
ncbi:glycosyltransferase [Phaeospirillum tilakii]|uniref:Glycosyltransferase n=1 Tax=Phaeospirillum tilakii TaxID=741673 RepID=A0ABW5CD76_9PROT